MGPGRGRSALLALLLAVPALVAVAPTADACATTSLEVGAVPCGRIYPLIILRIEDQAPVYPMAQGEPHAWDATLTYKFSVNDNGYTAAAPNEPVVVTFEYPRKPDWVELSVEPERVEIPVNDPRYFVANTEDPNNVQLEFVYTTPITIHAELNGAQPVLRDGYEYAKLLVFAKSTESGLYQAGYGIKEIRVAPEGALHESDVAGSRDVFVATPVSSVAVTDGAATFAGTTVAVTGPGEAQLWQPTTLGFAIEPAPAGRLVLAVTEESGALVAMSDALEATGAATLNVTFAHPGRHLATVTVLPPSAGPAGGALPLTYLVPFDVGDVAPEGFAYPKTYTLTETHAVPLPQANAADPNAQWERDIPFFAYDTAQSTVATVSLVTPGLDALGRSVANLQFAIIDPEGKQLQANSVDPGKPAWSIRIGSLPGDGWYTLRVSGVGAPFAAAFHARVEIAYALPHEARNRADGALDETPALVPLAGRNLTLPLEGLQVWTPNDFTPILEGVEGVAYQVTVTDDAGNLAYASGMRSGAATFTPPAPGTYHAAAYLQPAPGALFGPTLRAFTFTVGAGTETVAQTFSLADAVEVPFAPEESLVAAYGIQLPEGASLADAALTGDGVRGELLDPEGNPTDAPTAPGAYTLLVYATNANAPTTVDVAYDMQLAAPVTLAGPALPQDAAAATASIPGFAVALAIGTVGAAAVGVALVRRK